MSREEQLERLLREVRPTMPREVLELWCKDRDAALSQQAEPSKARHAPHCLLLDPEEPQCYCTCGLEPAPEQDEREAFKRALHSQKVFKLSSATIDAAEWAWFSRPAQASTIAKETTNGRL